MYNYIVKTVDRMYIDLRPTGSLVVDIERDTILRRSYATNLFLDESSLSISSLSDDQKAELKLFLRELIDLI